MERNQLADLINLQNVRGIGPRKIRNLVSSLGDPSNIFKQDPEALCRADGVDLKSAEKILNYTDFDYGMNILDRTSSSNARIVTFWDDNYPQLLKKIYDPPTLLYTRGIDLKEAEDSIAIVGSRNTTAYGRQSAAMITAELVRCGLTTVSGLARGIDTVVHRETLKSNGRTLAVLGSGVDVIYPPENRKLMMDILEKGSVISEFPPGMSPEARNFPMRNRIISGLSQATVVVEAGNRSGAILTALNAIDQNRDVFAVPGRMTDKQSVGCLRLISHGAVPVTAPESIVEMIKGRFFKPREEQQTLNIELTRDEHKVMEHLTGDPIHVDDLAELTGFNITELLTILLQLELKNAVIQLSGKQFVSA